MLKGGSALLPVHRALQASSCEEINTERVAVIITNATSKQATWGMAAFSPFRTFAVRSTRPLPLSENPVGQRW